MIVNGKECSCANCGNSRMLEEFIETDDGHFDGTRICKGFACVALVPLKYGHVVWMHDASGKCELWKEATE